MKLITTILLWLSVSTGSLAHEGHQAFYRLTVENGILTLESKLEIPDLKKALELHSVCSTDQDFNWCAGTWLANHVSITIDGTNHSLTLESSITESGHLILTHSLGELPADANTIIVKNTAFVNVISDYENVFQTSLSSTPIGFKMTKERTSIIIQINH